MTDRELKIEAYQMAIEHVKKNKYSPLERAKLIQKYNEFISNEKFLLERDINAEKIK